jgi:2-oxoglutarate ferredoxin oxidoreductase subunit alpha
LPLVVIDSQRGGPSTGLPTKTEQSDLYQAVYGRNADAPLPVLAARSPGDCFEVAIEAVRIALRHMTPVFVLTDGYLANAAEPWLIPDVDSIAPIQSSALGDVTGTDPHAAAFARDPKTLGRPWIVPGMPGLMHRIGGLEKDIATGHISYDAENHQAMTQLRADKVAAVADYIADQGVVEGPKTGKVAVVGWGSTYGALYQAVRRLGRTRPGEVAHIHIRHINPFPKNLAALLAGFDRIVVPEMNMGQLATLLRDKLGATVVQFNKVTGQPFLIDELVEFIEAQLAADANEAPLPRIVQGDRS